MLASSLTITGDRINIKSYDDRIVTPAVVSEEKIQKSPKKKTVEESVREYFIDTPELVSVAWCESRFRQFNPQGEVFRGEVNPNDIGVTQINTYYHLETANKLGIDIYTLEGNMKYAKYLYKKQGLAPWRSSSPCWNKFIGPKEVALAK